MSHVTDSTVPGTFTAKQLAMAVELMISKRDLRNNPKLCMMMLGYFDFTAKDIHNTLRKGKYIDFTRRNALGLVPVR